MSSPSGYFLRIRGELLTSRMTVGEWGAGRREESRKRMVQGTKEVGRGLGDESGAVEREGEGYRCGKHPVELRASLSASSGRETTREQS